MFGTKEREAVKEGQTEGQRGGGRGGKNERKRKKERESLCCVCVINPKLDQLYFHIMEQFPLSPKQYIYVEILR